MASSYPNGFNNGLVVREVPVLTAPMGNVFWVASTGSDNNPGTFLRPFLTLDYAVGRCTANNGDIIYVKEGYTQTMTAADDVDIDVAGVSVIGLGRGAKRPTFTYTVAAGEFVIGAANVRIENLKFVPGVTAVTHAVDVEATFKGWEIINCEFSSAVNTGTDEFNAAITVGTTATDGRIHGCFFNSEAAGAVYAISLATPGNVWITNNVIMGAYSTACIGTITGAGVNCHMYDNVIINGLPGGLNAVACFTQSAAGTWAVGRNMFAADVATAILFFTNYTSTINLGNVYTDDTSMAATAVDQTATIVKMADG